MKEVTIRDIAQQAGVSITTVSRAMNGNYPVSREVQQRVEKAVQELNYRPNAVARSLRSNRTNLVALIVADISNYFFMEAAKGLEAVLSKMDYQLVIASSGGSSAKEMALVESLLARRVDAMVIAPVDNTGKSIQACAAQGVPVTLIDRGCEGTAAGRVLWNNCEGAHDLTQLLLQNGHTRIGIVNVTLENSNGAQRLEGYLSAMREANCAVDPAWVSPSNFSAHDAYRFVTRLMRGPGPVPTALLCANNVMLEGTLASLRKLDLRVYDDVSLVVFGKPECNKYLFPTITAAEQDSFKMGECAGNMLGELLSQKSAKGRTVVLKVEIQQGGSIRRL